MERAAKSVADLIEETTDKNNAINTAKVIGTKLREDTLWNRQM